MLTVSEKMRVAVKNPAYWILALSSVFFLVRLEYLPFWGLIPILGVSLALEYYLLRKLIPLGFNRLRGSSSLGLELGIAIVCTMLLYLLGFYANLWVLIASIFLLIWAFLLLWSGKRGPFYMLIASFVLATLIAGLYRFVAIQEELLLYTRVQLLNPNTSDTSIFKIEKQDVGYALTRNDAPLLRMNINESFLYDRPETLPEDALLVQGSLGAFSSKNLYPLAFPSVQFFVTDWSKVEVFSKSISLALQHRQKENQIHLLRYEGVKEQTLPIGKLEGEFYSFQMNDNAYRMGYYVYPLSDTNALLVLIRDLPSPGFPHHPDLLFVLQSMERVQPK